MTRPGSGSGIGAMPAGQLVVVPSGFGWRFRLRDCFDLGVGQLLDGKSLTVPPLEAVIFLDRQNHQPVPAIAGNRQGSLERLVLKAAQICMENSSTTICGTNSSCS